jgi:aryl-alcohol dehydrogenase
VAPFEIGQSLIKGWTFKTIVQGSSVPQVFIPRLVDLWSQGRFPLEKLIRHYDLADINVAFKDSQSGATVKPVIVY